MSARPPASIDTIRYRHLGPDPMAKQLYAVTISAFQTYLKAAAALEQYLDCTPWEAQVAPLTSVQSTP